MNNSCIVNCVGSSLSRCTFNGLQCCSQTLLTLFANNVGPAIETDAFNFDATFNGVQTTVDQLSDETEGYHVLCYRLIAMNYFWSHSQHVWMSLIA